MARNEVKWGAILSYVLIIFNAVYGLIIAPFILSSIGNSEYGVYKTIGSMTASLAVLDLGLGATVQRYIAKYKAKNEEQTASNFSAMAFLQAGVLAFITALVSIGLYFSLNSVYGKSFTEFELFRAKQIFIVQAIYMVCHIFENIFAGIIAGNNKFVFSNTVKIISLIIKISLYCIFLPIFKNSLVIAVVALLLEFMIIGIEFIYIKCKLRYKIHLYKWDGAVFKETLLYTILLFIQSLIIQFNGNIDNIVIGAVIGTTAVTIYSFAIQIFGIYEQCATAVSGVILPTVVDKIENGADSKELERLVLKFGRVQWIVLGAILFGFIICGKEFFSLWLGKGFEDCWLLTLILIIPVTFPLIVNVCLAILKAKNLLKFRTISMLSSFVFNAVFTLIGTHYFGYWAAAAGTALSTVIGSVISMNIYYQKKLGINIFKLYFSIGKKVTLCMGVSALVCFGLNQLFYGSWVSLIIKIVAFAITYLLLLYVYGLNKEEKEGLFKRRAKK